MSRQSALSRVVGDDSERHMNLAETAALMGISPRMARKLREQGRLPYSRIGHAVRYRRGDVLAFLAANRGG